jgi:hypothetical protein
MSSVISPFQLTVVNALVIGKRFHSLLEPRENKVLDTVGIQIEADLLAQIGHRFGFRFIVEEGLSHGVLTQTQGYEPGSSRRSGIYGPESSDLDESKYRKSSTPPR